MEAEKKIFNFLSKLKRRSPLEESNINLNTKPWGEKVGVKSLLVFMQSKTS